MPSRRRTGLEPPGCRLALAPLGGGVPERLPRWQAPGRAARAARLRAALKAAENAQPRIGAYIVVSLLFGARTEEVRALQWSHVVAYDEKPEA